MALVSQSTLEQIRAANDIVDIIGAHVPLKRNGANFVCLCPFHKEKSPSFNVNPSRQIFRCFGCGKGGDVFTFVKEYENLDFMDAVRRLAERARIPLEMDNDPAVRDQRSIKDQLLKLHEAITQRWQQCLAGEAAGQVAREYLERRGVHPDGVREFRVGAAPEAWDDTVNWAKAKGFSPELCETAGLILRRDSGGWYDRFRGRLIFPICDEQGRVIAFSGRVLQGDEKQAKYVNSPETPIFSKSNLLFNLDRARSHVGEGKPFVLVEGQLDSLRSWSVGLKTAIAPQGTSITEGQLILLRRYHTQVECFFDGDSAGQKAALRFLPMALKAGLEVRFLGGATDTKIDPDLLFLEKGLAGYDQVRAGALSAMAFACRALLPSPETATPEQKARIAAELHALILNVESAVARSQFIAEAASILRLPLSALQQDFDSQRLRHERQQASRPAPAPTETQEVVAPPTQIATKDTPEHHLLLTILHVENIGPTRARTLPHEWIDLAHPAGSLLNRFLAEFEQNAWPGRDHLDDLLETAEERTLVASLLFETPKIDDPVKVVNFGLALIQSRSLEPRVRQIELALANTASDSNVDANSLFKELLDIKRQLRAPLRLPAA